MRETVPSSALETQMLPSPTAMSPGGARIGIAAASSRPSAVSTATESAVMRSGPSSCPSANTSAATASSPAAASATSTPRRGRERASLRANGGSAFWAATDFSGGDASGAPG